jgi:hypothetical protein
MALPPLNLSTMSFNVIHQNAAATLNVHPSTTISEIALLACELLNLLPTEDLTLTVPETDVYEDATAFSLQLNTDTRCLYLEYDPTYYDNSDGSNSDSEVFDNA